MTAHDALRVVAAVVAGAVVALIVYGFHPVARWRLRRVPGRRPAWLLGGIRDLRARGANAVHAADRAAFGPTWTSWGASRPFVMTVDAASARTVMLTHYNRPAFKTLWTGADAAFEGANLLSARGARHHALRSRLWSPMFYKGSLEAAKPVVASHAAALADSAAAAAAGGADAASVWDAASAFKSTTLNVIGSVAFGVDFRAAAAGSVGAELKAAIDEIVGVQGLTFSPWGGLLLLFPFAAPAIRLGARLFPDAGLKRLRATRARVIAVAERLLADHRAATAAAAAGGGAPLLDTAALRGGVAPGSFLDVCTRAVDPATGAPFPDGAIVAQCFLSILAGTDTTANALTFATHLLSLPAHGAQLAALLAEVDANAPPGTPARDVADGVCAAARWPYLDAVFRETLRLYPPAPMLARELGAPTTVGGAALPAGQWVATPLRLLHRDAALWGADADAFVPERWLAGHPAAAPPAAVARAFMPFGEGSRRCPAGSGRGGLAELEFKTVLVALLGRVVPVALPERVKEPLPLRQTITLAPRDGLCVALVPRREA